MSEFKILKFYKNIHGLNELIIILLIIIKIQFTIITNANIILPSPSPSPIVLQIGEKCGNHRKNLSLVSSSIETTTNLLLLSSNSGGSSSSGGGTTTTTTITLECDPEIPLECSGGRCQCKRGYTLNQNETKCLEIARNGLESICEENIQCWKGLPGRLSECLNSKCRCYESETLPIVFHQGRCYYGEGLGDYCQIEGLCSQTTNNATCRGGSCQCREGHVPSWDKSRCLQIATQGLSSHCEENIQCEKSPLGTLSECNQDTTLCQCYRIPAMVPTVFYSGRCYFGASLGDVCQVNAQCEAKTNHSMCGLDGKCHCRGEDIDSNIGGGGGGGGSGFIANYNNTLCLPLVLHVSDSERASGVESIAECVEDIQCTQSLGHFARCSLDKKKCECFSPAEDGGTTTSEIDNNHNNPNPNPNPMIIVGSKCYSSKSMGQTCKYNRQCSTISKNVKCISGICGCDEDTYVISQDGRRCLEIGKDGLGSPCEEDQQCMKSILGPLAICEDNDKKKQLIPPQPFGTCKCSVLLPVVFFEKKCYFQRQLGALCDTHLECRAGIGGELAECIDGRCQCQNGTQALSPHTHSCISIIQQHIPPLLSYSSSSFDFNGIKVVVITTFGIIIISILFLD